MVYNFASIRSCVIIFIFLLSTSLFSRLNTASDVQNLAQKFLHYKCSRHKHGLEKQISYNIDRIENLMDPDNNEILAYIVNIMPQGFLIISTDTEIQPIIAYSFRQNWDHNSGEENILYKLLIHDLRSRKKVINKSTTLAAHSNYKRWNNFYTISEMETSNFHQWPEEGTTPTGGWVETTWHQGDHYKQFCPIDPKDSCRCAVGCVATAMAQIINYHKYIGDLNFDGDDRYETAYRNIAIDADSLKYGFPGFGDLNNYLDSIKTIYKQGMRLDSLQQAALCFASGISIKMNYTAAASGISKFIHISAALKNKMGYHSADYSQENESFYYTLIENLINGLPAILILYNHALITDGYNTDGFFHLNCGWRNGNPRDISETWYHIPDSLPKDYNAIEEGILNINPYKFVTNPQISSSHKKIYFTGARIGESSTIKQFTLYNEGETKVSIDDLIASPNFYISTSGVDFNPVFRPTVIQPGEKLEVFVRCIPDSLGQIKGKLQILASSSNVNRYLVIDLIGYCIPDIGTTIIEESVAGVWEKSNSPYYIGRDIEITHNKQLSIQPGTKVIFMGSFQFSIENEAQLIAQGTQKDSIYFCAFDKKEGWQGFYFKSSGWDDTLEYCVVTNGYPQDRRIHSNSGVISVFSSSPTISHSRIVNNITSQHGAAIHLVNSFASITNTRLEENISAGNGGALYIFRSSPLISNIVICNNQARNGGAIYARSSSLVLSNITIANNRAIEKGGAIFLYRTEQFNIKNSIIWDNEAQSGASMAFMGISDADTISVSYSDIDTTLSNWQYVSESCDINRSMWWEHGNISSDPCFNDLQINDFTLRPDSPCIDAGDPADEVGQEPIPHGNRINMGAYGGTKIAAITTTIPYIDHSQPVEFTLSQNYPNPFNSRTKIRWQLAVGNDVDLSVYNLLGQKVATLVSERQSPGKHSVQWDASGLASGAYYYRLKAGEYVDVKKLVLLR